MTIGLVSLGCAKNAVDLQVMAGHLLKAGHAMAPDPDRADALIVNTCAFIEAAREEAVAEILRACELKREGAVKVVAVTGCFPQRYAADCPELFPDVDVFLGVDGIDRVVAALERALAGRRTPPRVAAAPRRVFDPPVPELRFTGKAFAYLKIAEGCAHRCAYCAIPGIRGRYRSRRPEAVVAEARALLASGVRELDVVAQDPMLYGVDFRGARRCGLVDLLRRLDELPGDFWIRVLYSYPSEISDAFIEWLNTSPHAVRYVDVPVQHTHPAVLAKMARGGAVRATREAAARLRAAVPGVTLRTTVMTGFPGETPRRFERLLADLREMAFDHLGAFAFSPEVGTAAAAMPGRPSAATAAARAAAVMAAQRRVWRKRARARLGETARALVVGDGVARLASQAPEVDGVTRFVVPRGAKRPAEGEFVTLRLDRVAGYDFEGTLVP